MAKTFAEKATKKIVKSAKKHPNITIGAVAVGTVGTAATTTIFTRKGVRAIHNHILRKKYEKEQAKVKAAYQKLNETPEENK